MFKWIKKLFNQNNKRKKSIWEEELEKRDPSKPINFGFKSIWAAIKTEDTENLLKVLALDKLEKVDWVKGIIESSKGNVFVLPPTMGWTILTGWGLPIPDHEKGVERSKYFLNKLSQNFTEAQLFGNHSVSSSAFWMKSINGKTERLYSIGDGNSIIEGNPTLIENKWELIDTNAPEADNEEYWDKMVYPDAKHVFEIAKEWSLNPMELESIKGIGQEGHFGKLKIK